MSLRHAVLGLLAAQPSSGYELTHRFQQSLANAWSASHSQIYPELAKLQDEGMVEVVAEGARNRKTWGITDAGRDELQRWLMETEPVRTQRNELALRGFLMFLLEPDERRILMERELQLAEEQAAQFAHLKQEGERAGVEMRFGALLDLGIRHNALMRAWLREQLDEV